MADGKKGGARASKFLRAVNRGSRPTQAPEGQDEQQPEAEIGRETEQQAAPVEEAAELESGTQVRSSTQ